MGVVMMSLHSRPCASSVILGKTPSTRRGGHFCAKGTISNWTFTRNLGTRGDVTYYITSSTMYTHVHIMQTRTHVHIMQTHVHIMQTHVHIMQTHVHIANTCTHCKHMYTPHKHTMKTHTLLFVPTCIGVKISYFSRHTRQRKGRSLSSLPFWTSSRK